MLTTKRFFLLIISVFLTAAAFAQSPQKQDYVIRFTDKGLVNKQLSDPSQLLSQKAIERRIRYQIPVGVTDIPVNDDYVSAVAGKGAVVKARSRWFNWIVVEATPEIIANVRSANYVLSVEPLGSRNAASAKLDQPVEKIAEQPELLMKKAAADKYDYGSAMNQTYQIKIQALHNQGYDGRGMTIAVIDAGFNSVDVMPCFDSLRANNQVKGTRDFAEPGNNVYGTWMHSHGTSVLSTMAANVPGQMVGTAPKADYWLLRSEVGSSESVLEEYYWVSAAEFADSIGADLINSSLGYTTFDDPLTNHTYADMDGNTTVCTNGADMAAAKGILVVNSAGNDGGNSWQYIGAPADGDSVFTIAAVGAAGFRASFSSKGPTSDGRIKPTVAGMGSGTAIYYPGGFGSGSGTSFSSPVICGATACLWQAMPDFNNMQIQEAIKTTASQASNPDTLLGWGIPDYQAALVKLTALSPNATRRLKVYPNPFRDQFSLSFPDTVTGDYLIEIISLQGKTVKQYYGSGNGMLSKQLAGLGELADGLYVIRMINGAKSFSARVIKR